VSFPISIRGQSYSSAEELARALEARARAGTLDHPGQMWPSEHFLEARGGEGVAAALDEAAALLVSRTAEPEVFRMALHCGSGRACHAAILDRIEHGAPVPDGQGTRNATLRADALAELPGHAVGRDAALRDRARAMFVREGDVGLVVRLHAWSDPDPRLADAVRDWFQRGSDDPNMAALCGTLLAQEAPDAILAVAPVVATRAEVVRRAFEDAVRQAGAAWYAANGAALRAVLTPP
jgi:hypothetical protein